MQNTSVIYATRVREVAAFLNRSRFPAAVSRQVLQSILPGGAAFKEFIQNGSPERQDGSWASKVDGWANRPNSFERLANGQPCGESFIEAGDTCHVGVTPEQDAAYAKAVKTGDTATAQKMVDAAAKASKVENPGISSRKATIARLDAEEQELWDIHPTSQVSKENSISGSRMDALAREERIRQAVLGSDRYAEIQSARSSLYKAIAKLQKQTPTFPVVTRDAQGNVIPLSKRFNKSSSKVSNRDDTVTATVLGQPVTVAKEPSEAQKESGNYKKGKVAWNGLQLSIENPKGGVRSGTNSEGATWATVMPASYGYIVGSEGADGDEVDVYLGDAPDSSKVFVIDQMDAETGEFDEHKVMLAFPNLFTALSTYHKGFSDGRGAERVGDVTPMTVDEFKVWLKTEDTTQPVSETSPPTEELDNDAPWVSEDALSNKACGKSFIGEEMECHIGETAPTKDAPVAAAAPAAAPKADKAGKTDSADAKPMSTMAASGQIKMVKPKSIEEVGKLLGELKAHVETAKALPDTDKMKELKVLHALQQQQRAIGASRKLSDKIGEYLGAQPEAAKTAESPKSPEAAVKSAEEKTVKPTAEEDSGKAAVTALKGGGDVVLKSVKEVNTAIEEIHKFANEAKKSGEKVNLNLCKVSVPGTNLFCGESLKGDDGKPIPRSEMPQLAGFPVKGSTVDDEKNFPKDKAGEVNVGEAFVQSLLKKGVKTEDLDQPASLLKASQSELKGSNVAFMMSPEGQKAVGLDENSIFVSRDGYVIDGHHRWAAKIGLDAKDGKFGDTKIKTRRIDMDIKDVLKAANKFTKEMGIAPKKLANAGNCGTDDGIFLREIIGSVTHQVPMPESVSNSGQPCGDSFIAGGLLCHAGEGQTVPALKPASTDSPEFKEWFGDSKVVDKDGKPLVVFHGTVEDFQVFDPNTKDRAHGADSAKHGIFFTSNPDDADGYASGFGKSPKAGANIKPAFLAMVNPMVLSHNEITQSGVSLADEILKAKANGHDGFIYMGGYGMNPKEEFVRTDLFVVFSPTQIKSKFNKGAWSKDDGNISNSGQPCGESFIEAGDTCHAGHGLKWISPALKADMDGIAEKYPAVNVSGIETTARYTNADGKWSAERTKLHDKLVSEVRAEAKPSENPEFVLMGGGPASGKSSAVNSKSVQLPANSAMVNADDLKAGLPEYAAMLKHGDDRAAVYAHEESSYLAKRILRESMKANESVVLDGTGNASLKAVELKVAAARAAGFAVRAEYVTCSTEQALTRSAARAEKTGRKVPDALLRSTHKSVSTVFPEAVGRGLFDTANLWDTEDDKPVLVASAVGAKMTIHHKAKWTAFLAKGNE